jgi:hypothetical protein
MRDTGRKQRAIVQAGSPVVNPPALCAVACDERLGSFRLELAFELIQLRPKPFDPLLQALLGLAAAFIKA